MGDDTTDDTRNYATVHCHVCRHEIPRSVAHSAEGQDYTFYFCGLDCFRRWRQNAKQSQDRQVTR